MQIKLSFPSKTFTKLQEKEKVKQTEVKDVEQTVPANAHDTNGKDVIANLIKEFENNTISTVEFKKLLSENGATNIEESGTTDSFGNWSVTITFNFNNIDYTVTSTGKGQSTSERKESCAGQKTMDEYWAWRLQHRTYSDITPFTSLTAIEDSQNDASTTEGAITGEYYEFSETVLEANNIIDPPLSSYGSLEELKEYGLSDEEIAQYFEEKSYRVTKNGIKSPAQKGYFIKDNININGENITTIKDLMVALNKIEYFNQHIIKLVKYYSHGDSVLEKQLTINAQMFFNSWNGAIEQFSVDLGQYLTTVVEDLGSHNGDYSNYKFISPNDFINEFKKGNMSFEEAINILTKAGATVSTQINNQWNGMIGTEITYIDLIHFEYNGVQYSVMRNNEATEVVEAENIAENIKTLAEQFVNGKLTIKEITEKLEQLGVENIQSTQFSKFKETGEMGDYIRQVAFTLNGHNYKITSYIPEIKNR